MSVNLLSSSQAKYGEISTIVTMAVDYEVTRSRNGTNGHSEQPIPKKVETPEISEIKTVSWSDQRKEARDPSPSGARLLDRIYAAVSKGDHSSARPLIIEAERNPGVPTAELNRSAFDFMLDEGEKELAAKSAEGLVGPGLLDRMRGVLGGIKKEMKVIRQGMEPPVVPSSINTWSNIPERKTPRPAPVLPEFVLDPALNLPPKPRFRPQQGRLPTTWKVA